MVVSMFLLDAETKGGFMLAEARACTGLRVENV